MRTNRIRNHRISRRQLDARALRRYRDARAIRSFRRFNDGVIQTLAEKGRSACAKAVEWCRQKKEEHPKLAKVITVLLKIDGSLNVLASSGLTGTGIGMLVSQRNEIKNIRNFAETAGFGPLKIILNGILGIFGGILKIAAANKIESL